MEHNLPAEEVATRLGITRAALFARIRVRGLYAARRIGRRLYFSDDVFRTPLALRG